MRTLLLLTVAVVCGIVWPAFVWAVDDPWADAVVAYSPRPGALYTDPTKALGPPRGGGPSTPDNTGLVSLGSEGGYIVLKFNTPVTDDPQNPMGLDCIIFSNAFWTGGNPQVKWEEPGLIEISEDVNGNGIADDPWYLIPGSRHLAYSPFPSISEPAGQSNSTQDPYLLAGSIRNPSLFDANPANDNQEYNWGYAKLTPTMPPYLDNYVRPDDPFTVGLTHRSGGGDAFDIAWAVDASGNPAHLTRFHFIRLTSFISRSFGALGVASPDIDAVADVAPDVDSDGDGIVDEYETRVAGTDPLRPESTVLPLEIPALEGGSVPGGLLGVAQDNLGDKLRLYADQPRTGDDREFNVTVDILVRPDPGPPLPSLSQSKSGCIREIVSSESDFVAAGIQSAQVTLHYQASDIVGLYEAGLQPYLFGGGGYSQSGITDVEVNAAANLVTFRTRYAGLFILASTAGSGDTGSTQGPQGAIDLSATPPQGVVADPVNTVSVVSGVILDDHSQVVSDGTLITVSAALGTIIAPDADLGTSGIQVQTAGGTISFEVQAPQQSGSALITATSVQGSAYGELNYSFLPGPPVAPVSWTVGKPEGVGPVSVTLVSNPIRDQFGNYVRDGVLLTLDVQDGAIVSGDADGTLPGFQTSVASGRAVVAIQVPGNDSVFTLSTFADPGHTQLLGRNQYSPAQYVPMPLRSGVLFAGLCVVAGLATRRKLRRGCQ